MQAAVAVVWLVKNSAYKKSRLITGDELGFVIILRLDTVVGTDSGDIHLY